MKTVIAAVLVSLLSGNVLFAQFVRFAPSGTIEFEKSVNMHALIKKTIDKDNEAWLASAFDQYKRTQAQFKKLKSVLVFSRDKTLFTPVEETETDRSFFGDNPMVKQNSTIFTDLGQAVSISRKQVYEETFLVKDSLRKIRWKITTETREIAGYQCRRANAIIMDSVYVVAFYTDKIPTSGGPESFSGLPGMILGVALPHENITWFATKVTDQPIQPAVLEAPRKGKQVNRKEFYDTILGALKDWGDYAQTALKAFML